VNQARPIDQQLHNLLLALAYPQTKQHLVILPYLGYGSRQTIYLHGHSLKKPRTSRTTTNDSRWRNSLNGFHRFSTREVPHVELEVDFENLHRVIETDETGYFDMRLDLPKPLAENQVAPEAHFRLEHQPETEFVGKVLVPPTDAEFGVISDLDDTVIRTQVNYRIRMLWNTFAHNAFTRKPVRGVAEFYRGLQAGLFNTRNPFFYVSSSPLKLYGFTLEFFQKHSIPLGPFLMRNIMMQGFFHLHKPPKMEHKLKHIGRILTLYPNLPFILIGDNGELDAEIYLEIVKQFPGQVATIYVHEV
jgi:phosphatidate phosphatase APP1